MRSRFTCSETSLIIGHFRHPQSSCRFRQIILYSLIGKSAYFPRPKKSKYSLIKSVGFTDICKSNFWNRNICWYRVINFWFREFILIPAIRKSFTNTGKQVELSLSVNHVIHRHRQLFSEFNNVTLAKLTCFTTIFPLADSSPNTVN